MSPRHCRGPSTPGSVSIRSAVDQISTIGRVAPGLNGTVGPRRCRGTTASPPDVVGRFDECARLDRTRSPGPPGPSTPNLRISEGLDLTGEHATAREEEIVGEGRSRVSEPATAAVQTTPPRSYADPPSPIIPPPRTAGRQGHYLQFPEDCMTTLGPANHTEPTYPGGVRPTWERSATSGRALSPGRSGPHRRSGGNDGRRDHGPPALRARDPAAARALRRRRGGRRGRRGGTPTGRVAGDGDRVRRRPRRAGAGRRRPWPCSTPTS